MNSRQIREFPAEEACGALLENWRWPAGVRCTQCRGRKISKITRRSRSTNKRPTVYQCMTCRLQFSATSGTVFHRSHLPLRKWFLAAVLIRDAERPVSTALIQRQIKVRYRTARRLQRCIAQAMKEGTLPDLPFANKEEMGRSWGRIGAGSKPASTKGVR